MVFCKTSFDARSQICHASQKYDKENVSLFLCLQIRDVQFDSVLLIQYTIKEFETHKQIGVYKMILMSQPQVRLTGKIWLDSLSLVYCILIFILL